MGLPGGQPEAQAGRLCEPAGENASSGERLMEGRGARRPANWFGDVPK